MSMSPAHAEVLRLVVGMFGAAPSANLFASLTGASDQGVGTLDMARSWGDTDLFRALGPYPDSASFANGFARHSLGLASSYDLDAPSASAEFRMLRDWIASREAAGDARGEIAHQVIFALAGTDIPAFQEARHRMENRVQVAEYYLARGGNGDTLAVLQAVIANVSGDDQSVTSALGAVDLTVGSGTAGLVPFPGRFDVAGTISQAAPHGEVRVDLEAGRSYVLQATAAPGSQLDPEIATVLGPDGQPVAGWSNSDFFGRAAQLTLTPTVSGEYVIQMGGQGGTIGAFSAALRDVTNSGLAIQTVQMGTGTTMQSLIDSPFARQEFSIELTAGQSVNITLGSLTSAANPLLRPKIFDVRDPEGNHVTSARPTSSPDFGVSTLQLQATSSGAYKILVGDAYNDLGAFYLEIGTTRAISRERPATVPDDAPATVATGLSVVEGSTARGAIEIAGDSDWIGLDVVGGRTYLIELQGIDGSGGTLSDPLIHAIYNANGVALPDTNADDSPGSLDSQLLFTAPASGRYYLEARGYGSEIGSYTLRLNRAPSLPDITGPDLAAAATTTASVVAGGTTGSAIELAGDRDWIAMDLLAGSTYRLNLGGRASGVGTLADPVIYSIRDASGVAIDGTFDDDGGGNLESRLDFSPASSARYYVEVGGYGTATGSYSLGLTFNQDDAPASVATTLSVGASGSATGRIDEAGDTDWIRVRLSAGTTYQMDIEAPQVPAGGYLDGVVISGIYDSAGHYVHNGIDQPDSWGSSGRVYFSPPADGTYFVAASGFVAATDYTLRLSTVQDDAPASIATPLVVRVDGSVSGTFERDSDVDWIRATLTAGVQYHVQLDGAGTGPVAQPRLYGIFDHVGNGIFDGLTYAGQDAGTDVIYFTPTRDGDYFIATSADQGTGGYSLQLRRATDDAPVNASTTLLAAVGVSANGIIDAPGDRDWIGVDLTAGSRYQIDLRGAETGGGTLADPYLRGVYSATGVQVAAGDDDGGAGLDSRMFFTPNTSGNYFIEASGFGNDAGSYTVNVSVSGGTSAAPGQQVTTDLPNDITTPALLTVGSSISSNIEASGDTDWIRLELVAGHLYEVNLEGSPTGAGTLADPYIAGIHDANGTLLAGTSDDDSGAGTNASTSFVPNVAGNYFVAARAYADATGSYSLSVGDMGPVTALATTAPAPVPPATPGTWTIMVYLAADNDLEPFAMQDINEMESAILPEGVNVIVGIDRAPGYDTSNGDWTDSRAGIIQRDTSTSLIGSTLYSFGELDMGDPATLTAFIDLAAYVRPADNYALIIWDHGSGTGGVCVDDSSGQDNLSLEEISNAIRDSNPGRASIVGFDACLQGMVEQAHALDGLADWLVASEQLVPGEGWNYRSWLTDAFASGANANANTVTQAAVRSFGDNYVFDSDVTLSSVDLTRLSRLEGALQAFTSAAQSATAGDWAAIDAAMQQAQRFDGADSVDLGAFAENLSAGSVGVALGACADGLVNALDAVVTARTANDPGATGLSIYWPEYRPYDFSSDYNSTLVTLAGAVGWDGFLQSYWAHA